ncbi:hypothetical protein Tco_1362200 [Tanacetum coccineum]
MEILPLSSSNNTAVDVSVMRTSKYSESNAYASEDLTLLSWKPCQGGYLNLPDQRSSRWCNYPIPAESDSSPHAHTQDIKTYYKHQDFIIKKAKDQRQRLPQL